ncbi:innexin inx2 isoform X2 [Folsomia candida]|uniref:innexin inx2 isoform X2 n=1 Tax=Folsomia candida TaxID=158441 RepID=UPI001604F442|nr:innexin inx2 isoform X2 [Folsomia candida]
MIDVFGCIKALVKLESICIDNIVFRLHYKITVILLITFSLLVNSRQYFGDPIDCTSTKELERVIDTYCWMHSYITSGTTGDQQGLEVPFPGVRPKFPGDTENYQRYYQWVGFYIFFQACTFFLPRYVWRYCWEDGRMKALVANLTSPIHTDFELVRMRQRIIIDYLYSNVGTHQAYAFKFFFCEVLNFLNVIFQILLTDAFLGYQFTTYGFEVMTHLRMSEEPPEKRTDPMSRIFPKVAQCTFTTFGHAGSKNTYSAICILSINILNEKIFIVVWFWYLILAVITGSGLIFRILTIACPPLRVWLLTRKSRAVESFVFTKLANELNIGDWFILYQVGKNLDELVFGELLKGLAHRFGSLRKTSV